MVKQFSRMLLRLSTSNFIAGQMQMVGTDEMLSVPAGGNAYGGIISVLHYRSTLGRSSCTVYTVCSDFVPLKKTEKLPYQ